MADKKTLAVYAAEAETYARRFNKAGENPHLGAFLAPLAPGARILDLGCGPGNTAAAMVTRGYRVDAWDASPEFAAIAKANHGLDVTAATFDELVATAVYDGVYANFSLLHAPKTDMPGHLARIATALKPKGRFHIGTKTGTGEKRDALGRFYAYYQPDELKRLLDKAGFSVDYERSGEDVGLDGTVASWIILQANRND